MFTIPPFEVVAGTQSCSGDGKRRDMAVLDETSKWIPVSAKELKKSAVNPEIGGIRRIKTIQLRRFYRSCLWLLAAGGGRGGVLFCGRGGGGGGFFFFFFFLWGGGCVWSLSWGGFSFYSGGVWGVGVLGGGGGLSGCLVWGFRGGGGRAGPREKRRTFIGMRINVSEWSGHRDVGPADEFREEDYRRAVSRVQEGRRRRSITA